MQIRTSQEIYGIITPNRKNVDSWTIYLIWTNQICRFNDFDVHSRFYIYKHLYPNLSPQVCLSKLVCKVCL